MFSGPRGRQTANEGRNHESGYCRDRSGEDGSGLGAKGTSRELTGHAGQRDLCLHGSPKIWRERRCRTCPVKHYSSRQWHSYWWRHSSRRRQPHRSTRERLFRCGRKVGSNLVPAQLVCEHPSSQLVTAKAVPVAAVPSLARRWFVMAGACVPGTRPLPLQMDSKRRPSHRCPTPRSPSLTRHRLHGDDRRCRRGEPQRARPARTRSGAPGRGSIPPVHLPT